jgi:hypothetical protein
VWAKGPKRYAELAVAETALPRGWNAYEEYRVPAAALVVISSIDGTLIGPAIRRWTCGADRLAEWIESLDSGRSQKDFPRGPFEGRTAALRALAEDGWLAPAPDGTVAGVWLESYGERWYVPTEFETLYRIGTVRYSAVHEESPPQVDVGVSVEIYLEATKDGELYRLQYRHHDRRGSRDAVSSHVSWAYVSRREAMKAAILYLGRSEFEVRPSVL